MILKVPYYSQVRDTKNPKWKDKSCGIAALKMVLDYYSPTNLTIDDLYQKGLDLGGYKEGVGWYHHSLALLSKSLGYKAITRSWNIPKESLEHLQERGFSKEDIKIVNQQQMEEGIFSLKNELENGHPVVVSVNQGFGEHGQGHLVTLIGYDEIGFILNDPYEEIRLGKEFKISFDDFKGSWIKRAILIQSI